MKMSRKIVKQPKQQDSGRSFYALIVGKIGKMCSKYLRVHCIICSSKISMCKHVYVEVLKTAGKKENKT